MKKLIFGCFLLGFSYLCFLFGGCSLWPDLSQLQEVNRKLDDTQKTLSNVLQEKDKNTSKMMSEAGAATIAAKDANQHNPDGNPKTAVDSVLEIAQERITTLFPVTYEDKARMLELTNAILKGDLEKATALKDTYKTEFESLKTEREKLQLKIEHYTDSIETIRKERDATVTSIQAEYSAQLNKLKLEQAQELEKIKLENDKQLVIMMQTHSNELDIKNQDIRHLKDKNLSTVTLAIAGACAAVCILMLVAQFIFKVVISWKAYAAFGSTGAISLAVPFIYALPWFMPALGVMTLLIVVLIGSELWTARKRAGGYKTIEEMVPALYNSIAKLDDANEAILLNELASSISNDGKKLLANEAKEWGIELPDKLKPLDT